MISLTFSKLCHYQISNNIFLFTDCKDYIYTVLLTKERTSERNYHYWDSQESFVRTCRRTNVADHKNL